MVAVKRYEITEIISVESDSPRVMRMFGRIKVTCRIKRMRSKWILELGYFEARDLIRHVEKYVSAVDDYD